MLRAELRPEILPDVSAIRFFDCKLLKHVEVRERNLLPSLEGNVLKMVDFVSVLRFASAFVENEIIVKLASIFATALKMCGC